MYLLVTPLRELGITGLGSMSTDEVVREGTRERKQLNWAESSLGIALHEQSLQLSAMGM